MSEQSLQQLSPEEAQSVLASYARRTLGEAAEVGGVIYREDYQVWEAWVSGVEGYVKAYIVRLAPSNGEWICRHITVMDAAPRVGRRDG